MSLSINSASGSCSSSWESRLNAYPELKTKFESILSMVENAEGNLKSAHEAEQQMIEEIQKLGQSALQGWATQQNEQQREIFAKANVQAHRHKKNSLLV